MSKIDRFKPRPQFTSIAGLTETVRMPRLGKIRLGTKVKKAKADSRCKHEKDDSCIYCTRPKDVTHFVVPLEVAEVYGPEPIELDILLPCDDMSMFFPHALECYRGTRLFCKGDGTQASRIDQDTGAMELRSCKCELFTTGECKPRGHLMFFLYKVNMSGCYQLDTGSIHNITEIVNSVRLLRGVLNRIALVPLKLRRVVTTIQDPTGKSIQKALIKIGLEGSLEEIARYRNQDILGIQGPAPKALPPAPEEDLEGPVEVEEEVEIVDTTEEPDVLDVDPDEKSPEDAPGEDEKRKPYHPDAPQVEVRQDPETVHSRGKWKGGPISGGKARLLFANFHSRGVLTAADMDKYCLEWYGTKMTDIPVDAFEDAKGRIAALGPVQGEEDSPF